MPTIRYSVYDPDLGRWWRPDPIFQPWQSPYSAFDGNPIMLTDVWGLESAYTTQEDGETILMGTNNEKGSSLTVIGKRDTPNSSEAALPTSRASEINIPTPKDNTNTYSVSMNKIGISNLRSREEYQIERNINRPPVTTTAKSRDQQVNLLAKVWLHYQTALGGRLYLNANELDFTNITQSKLTPLDDGTFSIDLADMKDKNNGLLFNVNATGIILGKINLKRMHGNVFCILPDEYDFNIEWKYAKMPTIGYGLHGLFNKFENIVKDMRERRNYLTALAGLQGPVFDNIPLLPTFATPFYIYINGNIIINP